MYLKNKKLKNKLVHFELLLISLMLVGVFFYIFIQKMNYIILSTDKVTPTVFKKEDKQINIVLTQPVRKVKPIQEVKKVPKKVVQKPIKPIAEKKIKKTPPKKVKKVLETVVKKPTKVLKNVKPVIQKVQKVVQKPKKVAVVFDAKIKENYINELYELLNKNKHYPKMARRRHLEGTSYVGFTLCKDGSIKNVVLIKSSGHKILDKASLKLLKKIRSYKPIPKTVSRVSLNLKIPIKYKRI